MFLRLNSRLWRDSCVYICMWVRVYMHTCVRAYVYGYVRSIMSNTDPNQKFNHRHFKAVRNPIKPGPQLALKAVCQHPSLSPRQLQERSANKHKY